MKTKRTLVVLAGRGNLREPDLLSFKQIEAILEFFEADKRLAACELRQIERTEKELAAAGLYDLEKIEIKGETRHCRSANPVVLRSLMKEGEQDEQS